MLEILNNNFNPTDVINNDFATLFETKRRDAMFAFVYRDDGGLYAIRDHLGSVPLFYRYHNHTFRFSLYLDDLMTGGMTLDVEGVRHFIGFQTAKLKSLFTDIHIVPAGSVVKFDEVNGTTEIVYQYKIKPQQVSVITTMKRLVDTTDALFLQAIRRLIRADTVGLYLSGGMDSGLIGIYLKKLGVRVHAYTSAPWGRSSSELEYAAMNVKAIGIDQHYIDYLEPENYANTVYGIRDAYRNPHGSSTAVGVTSMWQNTPISQEPQVFFGQNSDTMTCSVSLQYLTYFSHFLPNPIKKRLHIPADSLEAYLSLYSKGLINHVGLIHDVSDLDHLSHIQALTVAGMVVVHSPSDGEVLSQPAIRHGIPVANPYYDMDLIEFMMGMPLVFRMALTRDSKSFVTLQKRTFRALGLRYLPQSLVFRKKGFTISFDRNEHTKAFFQTFPTAIQGIPVRDPEQRIAAELLKHWCEPHALDCQTVSTSE